MDSKYVYGFQFTDNGTSIIRVVSQDWLFLYKDDDVTINGPYHKKLYADGLNLENIIVASRKNIKVILTGEDYTDLLVNYVGKGIIKNESLQKKSIVLAALIPCLRSERFISALYFTNEDSLKGEALRGMWKAFSAITRNGEWGKIIHTENCGKGGWNPMAILTLYLFTGEQNQKIAVECKYKEKEYERIFGLTRIKLNVTKIFR